MQSRRERVRQAAIEEIKSIAWDIAAEDGTEQVTVNGIARRMGMTPPAFYSYFKSRDDLLGALVVDAYRSFRHALIDARDSLPQADPAARLFHLFMAYREWAVTNPNMFGLFAGRRVHGFKTQDPKVVEEADKVYDIFLSLYEEVWEDGAIIPPQAERNLPSDYASEIDVFLENRKLSLPREVFNRILRNAMLVHGMISMELSGRFSQLAGNSKQFYCFQILDMMREIGIDYSPDHDF